MPNGDRGPSSGPMVARVHQKAPEIISQQSRARGKYFVVRKYPPTMERLGKPKGTVVFRSEDRAECQAFIDNGCRAIKKAPKKKAKDV